MLTDPVRIEPVVVYFPEKGTVAHLYYGLSDIDAVKQLEAGSVHVLMGPVDGYLMEKIGRALNQKCDKVPTGLQLTQLLDQFEAGCCPECFTPWEVGFDLTTMDDALNPACNCGHKESVPCTALECRAGDGANAIKVLKAGLNYIGLDPQLSRLGEACTRIQAEVQKS